MIDINKYFYSYKWF